MQWMGEGLGFLAVGVPLLLKVPAFSSIDCYLSLGPSVALWFTLSECSMTCLTCRLLQGRDWALFNFILSDAKHSTLGRAGAQDLVNPVKAACLCFPQIYWEQWVKRGGPSVFCYNRKEWSTSQCGKGCVCRNISAVSVGNVCGHSGLLPKNHCSWLQELQLLLLW